MKRVFLVALAVVLVVGLIFAGCAKEVTPTTPTTPTTPQYGGILKIITGRAPKTIGYQVSGSGHKLTVPCIETLFRGDKDGNAIPWLVESVELAPDNSSYTFNLRKGIKFHDGTDFNAEAVKWNLEDLMKIWTQLACIDSLDVVDEYTIQINLKEYDNMLLYMLTEKSGAMISPTAVKNNGVDWAKMNPVGTGPFEFVSYEPEVSLKFKKFDNYWQEGKPYLDGIEYRFMADTTMATMSFEAGEAQVLDGVPVLQAADLEGKGYELTTGQGTVKHLSFDSANPDSPFADQRVREAVEYALDREALVEGLGFGIYQPAYQMCPPGYFGHLTDIEGRSYDPTKAKQLLTEAGYPNGFKTTMLYGGSAGEADLMVAVQEYLLDVGIDADLQMATAGRWDDWVYNGWKGILLAPGLVFANTTAVFVQIFSPTKYVSNLLPPEHWAMVAKATSTTSREEQIQFTEDIYRAIYDFAAKVPIWIGPAICVTLPSVHDHSLYEWSMDRWSAESVWLSE